MLLMLLMMLMTYRFGIKHTHTQKQLIKDEYILNIGSVLILLVLFTVYHLDLFWIVSFIYNYWYASATTMDMEFRDILNINQNY